MNARALATLILLNAVLLAGVAVTSLSPQPAQAQLGGGRQYSMLAGEVAARDNQEAIYIVNLQTSQIIGLLYNTANNSLDVVDGRVISDDLQRAPGGRR